MFYSHEILSNSQYGVATIWLVATVGKSKGVTRKAIQRVNVPKACETILDPGAPLALRLQGNLLYGVSRVFSHQCGYVLSDAEKTQSDMMTFFRVMQTSETDPQAGKAKRHQITLVDDPAFDPLSMLPNLDLLNTNGQVAILSSQISTQRLSQMTPLKGMSQGSSSSGNAPLFGFNLPPPSSRSANSYRLPSDFGHSPMAKKGIDLEQEEDQFCPVQIDEFEPFMDLGLNFDADGNIIDFEEGEPELPPLPGQEMPNQRLHENDISVSPKDQVIIMNTYGDDHVLILGEDSLPDAEAFPKPTPTKRNTSTSEVTDEASTVAAATTAKIKRTRRCKAPLMCDPRDNLSSHEIRRHNDQYLENMDAARKRPRITTTAQARKNAMAFMFGNGVAEVGMFESLTGIMHPLAEDFAGNHLKARLEGRHPGKDEETEKRGRRRNSSEAFEDEDEEQRRVKQRLEPEAELARGLQDDVPIPGDDTAPEIGMEGAAAMEERHSSSMMPWSRPPSVVPGSSVRGVGSAQKGMPAPSPLLGRGSIIKSIERHSDLPMPDSDDLAQLYSQDSSIDFGGPVGQLDFTRGQDSQVSSGGLDIASQEFLGYATAQAEDNGLHRSRDRPNRRWIDFEQLANPEVHTKSIAAQAFLHVLSLATQNVIAVEQEGIQKKQPFGTIHVGLNVHEQDNMIDELA